MSYVDKYDLCTVNDRNHMLIKTMIGGGWTSVATFRNKAQADKVLKLLQQKSEA